MRNDTRRAFNAYLEQLARLNDVPSASERFTAAPSVQQTLETKIQESSDFLSRINVIGVSEQSGEKLGLGVSSPIASTTDTSTADRETRDPTSLDPQDYFCHQTNFDTHISYSRLDAWSKFPDFQTRIRDTILRRQSLDRIMIGFNGINRAASSNAATNPLLQDVNKGWLQHYREQAPARVLSDGPSAAVNQVTVGAGGDYENLDALVFDAVNNLIDPWHQENTALVVICSRELLADKYFPLINGQQVPTEKLATDLLISQKRMGGQQVVRAPFMPPATMLITLLENLSLYWQEGTRRRQVVDNARRDRIENFESSNDAYVVEDFGAGCVVENITLV